MPSKNNQITNRNSQENKTFDYSRGSVTLKFTLRVDIKNQLQDFLELLNAATQDVVKELDNRFPKSK